MIWSRKKVSNELSKLMNSELKTVDILCSYYVTMYISAHVLAMNIGESLPL